jgi:ATP-dependent DNA helicase RecG
MTSSQIDAVLQAGESESVEFKPAQAPREEIARVVCGFLNSKGGELFIGVQDSGKLDAKYAPSPQDADDLVDWLRRAISPTAVISGSIEDLKEGQLLVIDVPPGPDAPYVFQNAIHVRNETRTIAAQSEQVSVVIQSRLKGRMRWESQAASGFSINDLDQHELTETVNEATKRNRWFFHNREDPETVLRDLGLIDGRELNYAALALFGKSPGRNLPQLSARATVFDSGKSGERFSQDKNFDGNLFVLFSKLESFCEAQIDLSSEFRAGEWKRDDKPAYPFAAVREGILNALIHQDFSSSSGSLTVGLYPDRLEIWNFGGLPDELSLSSLKTSHASLPRNPLIARVFFIRGLIEKIGRGTVKIVEQCREFKLPPPTWKKDSGGTRLILRARKGATEVDQSKALNERQQGFLATMAVGARFTSEEYLKQVGGNVTSKTARNDLADLVEGGLVTRHSSGPATYYRVEFIPKL